LRIESSLVTRNRKRCAEPVRSGRNVTVPILQSRAAIEFFETVGASDGCIGDPRLRDVDGAGERPEHNLAPTGVTAEATAARTQ